MLTHLTKKPGEFKAFCRQPRWVGVADLLTMNPMPTGPFSERWNPKLRHTEVWVPCDFTTAERAAFEAHMRDAHYRTTRGQIWAEESTRHLMPSTRPRRVALTPDGQPFKTSAKTLLTCETCGLIAEVRDMSGELWWAEHTRGCALAVAGAAS